MIFTEDLPSFWRSIQNSPGPILGIDYGTKKIGLALSDNNLIIASPYQIIKNIDQDSTVANIERTLAEKKCRGIILGWPKTPDNNLHHLTKDIYELATILYSKTKLPVLLWDERMSTSGSVRRQTLTYQESPSLYPKNLKNINLKRSKRLDLYNKKYKNIPSSSLGHKEGDDHLAAQYILSEVIELLKRLH